MQKKRGKIGALPLLPESYWINSNEWPRFSSLSENIHTQIIVIGGGITGITTAYLLAKSGCKVVLIDGDRLFHGTTGHTTAKITAQHGFIYHDLIRQLGTEKAKQYYQANMEAKKFIEQQIKEKKISCEFREEKAFLYAMNESSRRKIEQENHAYQRLGIDGQATDQLPLGIDSYGAVVMNKQAQFHPLAYLTELVSNMVREGVQIYENTKAVDIVEGSSPEVIVENGRKITGDQIIIASHFPFYDGGGLYFTRLKAVRSYVLALRGKTRDVGGMYISADDPVRSIRSVHWQDESLIFVGGESHQTGQGIDTMNHYEALAQYAEKIFGEATIAYRWSAQDLTSLDQVPYIGSITAGKPNIYIATGYRKWGMTQGTIAATLLSDQVLGRDNSYTELYTPSRFRVNPSVKQVTLQGLDVAAHLLKGKLEIPTASLTEIGKDEAAVVVLGGDRTGAYRDREGTLHLVDTTCTHLGCEVEWNDGDRTWDCPCHGSRFSFTGDVIEGPAKKPLMRLGHFDGDREVIFTPELDAKKTGGQEDAELPSS